MENDNGEVQGFVKDEKDIEIEKLKEKIRVIGRINDGKNNKICKHEYFLRDIICEIFDFMRGVRE